MKYFSFIDENQMNTDIENRIQEMEDPAYRFPRRFGPRDYITVAVVAVVCLFFIIVGYHL
ncbi:MAG: hypothetical protein LUG13_05665 [Oscillospiraceae bacterium]|nr:hypothetical protein [Oscillospiraceae bacterium]